MKKNLEDFGPKERELGFLARQVEIPDNFKDLGKEEILEMFYGEEENI